MAPVIIVIVLIAVYLMSQSKNPNAASDLVSPGVQQRVQQLVTAISGIEGGSPTNPGNIKNSLGSIAETADLTAKINYDFVLASSSLYSPDMSFTRLAWMYVAGTVPDDWSKVAAGDNPDNWASYVAGALGVSVDSTVGDFLNS